MERQGTRFLTSASLVEVLNGAKRDNNELKVDADNHRPLIISVLQF